MPFIFFGLRLFVVDNQYQYRRLTHTTSEQSIETLDNASCESV